MISWQSAFYNITNPMFLTVLTHYLTRLSHFATYSSSIGSTKLDVGPTSHKSCVLYCSFIEKMMLNFTYILYFLKAITFVNLSLSFISLVTPNSSFSSLDFFVANPFTFSTRFFNVRFTFSAFAFRRLSARICAISFAFATSADRWSFWRAISLSIFS